MPSLTPAVELHALAGDYVIARFSPSMAVPADLLSPTHSDGFMSITRTPQELSIVCPAAMAPPGAEMDGPWKALYAAGPMPFGLTGVVASLVAPLSAEGCPVFVTSTFDGDVLMVPSAKYDQARELLSAAGHTLR